MSASGDNRMVVRGHTVRVSGHGNAIPPASYNGGKWRIDEVKAGTARVDKVKPLDCFGIMRPRQQYIGILYIHRVTLAQIHKAIKL